MQITLEVPDEKVDFFMELIDKLGLVEASSQQKEHFVLTKEQIDLVEIERKKAIENPESLTTWDQVLKQLDPNAC